MEVIQGSVIENGNGARPPAGGGQPAKGEKRRGAAKPDKETVVGRQDKDGQEAAIDLTALKKGMPKAIKLEKDLADARSDASAFYKKFAKECGLNTAQLKKAAKSYADEDAEAQRRKAEQMSLIFENCGA
jgi:hypothetical protein